jgi:hypothetical protein
MRCNEADDNPVLSENKGHRHLADSGERHAPGIVLQGGRNLESPPMTMDLYLERLSTFSSLANI